MIRLFKCAETERIFNGIRSKRFPLEVQHVALRKLTVLDAAAAIDDLRAPPGNRLEKLKGDREGQWSIRVNDQFRICFTWTDHAAEAVEMVDYH